MNYLSALKIINANEKERDLFKYNFYIWEGEEVNSHSDVSSNSGKRPGKRD